LGFVGGGGGRGRVKWKSIKYNMLHTM
jgi:hypothetical protein